MRFNSCTASITTSNIQDGCSMRDLLRAPNLLNSSAAPYLSLANSFSNADAGKGP